MPKTFSYSFSIIVCIFLFASIGKINGQVTANFGAVSTGGCSPFIADFVDSSFSATGGIVYRFWDFGNGNTASGNNPTVSATYGQSGTYTVTLTVSNGFDTATITKTAYIHVFESPVASFTSTSTLIGCAPLNIQFNGLALPGDAPIVSYVWDFGDGSQPSYSLNPSHTYNFTGNFNVSLTAIDANGCENTYTLNNYVQVEPKPVAAINTVGPKGICQAPLFVQYVNNSTGTPPLSYFWDLGNGTTTTIPTPSTNYTQNGFYNVTLAVEDGNGCVDTLYRPHYIAIGSIFADFNAPDTACANSTVQFYNNSGGGGTYSWNFGNGLTSNLEDPTTVYTAGGFYTVTLIISSGSQCSDTISKQIYVDEVNADWTVNPSYGCDPPLLVQFTDQSLGNVASYQWYFGNPVAMTGPISNPSAQQNPSFTFIMPGSHDDTLIVTSAFGCLDTTIKVADVIVSDLIVDFTETDKDGCAPIQVDFTDLTTPQDSILSWHWDFDTGDTSLLQNPTYTFQNPGIYDVRLTVTDSSGCTHELIKTFNFGSVQNAFFAPDTTHYCASDTVTFNNLSTDTSLITTYTWRMGDGGSTSNFGADYTFGDTGWMEVMLIVDYYGCLDSFALDSTVYIMGPHAALDVQYDCVNHLDVQFTSGLAGATSFWWDFGDTTAIDSVNPNPLHSYAHKNIYGFSFYAEDSTTGCTASFEDTVILRIPEAVILLNDSAFCTPATVVFNGNQSVDGTSFEWDYGLGGLNFVGGSVATHPYSNAGTYTVWLKVEDDNGCVDSTSKSFKLYDPYADFSADTLWGCKGLNVNFTDQSLSDTAIASYLWTVNNVPFSTQANPTHIFTNAPNVYSIGLLITDTLGCTDYTKKDAYIETTQPPSYYYVFPTNLCLGDTADFANVPTAPGYQYYYDFGDGFSSTSAAPDHPYFTSGTYFPSLTITDVNGCDSTYTRPVYVYDAPDMSIYADIRDTSCYPARIQFTDTIADSTALNWQWFFGDSSSSVFTYNPTVSHLYTSPGVFDIKLIVTSDYGCVDSLLIPAFIDIGGPEVDYSIQPDTACFGQPVTFVGTSNNYDPLIRWDFGDGTITQPTGDLTQYHSYWQEGWLTSFIYYNDSTGNCPQIDSLEIFVDRVKSEFLTDTISGCQPFLPVYSNISHGSNQYLWYADGALFDTVAQPSYTFTDEGVYKVELQAFNDTTLCRDTSEVYIEVFPKPFILESEDQLVCLGETLQINAAGGVEYSWYSNGYLSDTEGAVVTVSPNDTTLYFVDVVSDRLCENTDTVVLYTMPPPELLYMSSDTVLFLGQSYLLEAKLDMPVWSQWNPDLYLDCASCLSTYATPEDTMNYIFTYSDTLGCFTLDTNVAIDIDKGFRVTTPNSFTPNGDGLNDLFTPAYFGAKRVIYFGIFDRWGKEMFSTTDLNQGWDGTHNGKPCQKNQVYVYRVIAESYAGQEFSEIGKVFLIGKD